MIGDPAWANSLVFGFSGAFSNPNDSLLSLSGILYLKPHEMNSAK